MLRCARILAGGERNATGTRAERRNATGTGRQCDDGEGMGECGGARPADDWRGHDVAGIGGIAPCFPGAAPGFVLAPRELKLHDVISS